METHHHSHRERRQHCVETEQSRSSGPWPSNGGRAACCGWKRLRALRAHAGQFGVAKLLSQPRLAATCSCRRQLPSHRQVAHNPRSSGAATVVPASKDCKRLRALRAPRLAVRLRPTAPRAAVGCDLQLPAATARPPAGGTQSRSSGAATVVAASKDYRPERR
jgi:hypothetical protein